MNLEFSVKFPLVSKHCTAVLVLVVLILWIPDRTEFLDADSLDDEQAGVGELATEIKADGNCSSHDPMLRGFVDQSRHALWWGPGLHTTHRSHRAELSIESTPGAGWLNLALKYEPQFEI